MKCIICKGNNVEDQEEEFVCNDCGAAFCFNLLGYYEEGSSNRIECGDSYDKWLKKHKIEFK